MAMVFLHIIHKAIKQVIIDYLIRLYVTLFLGKSF